MFSYYFQERSYYYANDEDVKSHILAMNKIVSSSDNYDHFLMSDGFDGAIYNRWITIGSFLNSTNVPKSITNKIWPSIKKRCKIVHGKYMTFNDMNKDCYRTSNAFLGPKFYRPYLGLIMNFDQYVEFRAIMAIRKVEGNNFGKSCEVLLKNIVVTKDAMGMVKPLGQNVKTIFAQLIEFEDYIRDSWTTGSFSIEHVKEHTKLDISDESESVKKDPQYNYHRYFKIPGVGSFYCFIHIKKGDLRFHIHVDNKNKRIYVPYIGPHLPTKKYQ